MFIWEAPGLNKFGRNTIIQESKCKCSLCNACGSLTNMFQILWRPFKAVFAPNQTQAIPVKSFFEALVFEDLVETLVKLPHKAVADGVQSGQSAHSGWA